MLAALSVSELLQKTASGDPVPGGGSMAALGAAVSASLAEMVANLTIGKKGYEAAEIEMRAVADKMRPLREKLLGDMDRDADAYREVFSAFKLPKGTDQEKNIKERKIQDSLKHAAKVPLSVAEDAFAILKLTQTVISLGNRNAVSDGAVAAMMARTAVLSALCNVRINLGSIKDEIFVNEMKDKADRLENAVLKKEKEILSLVNL